MLPSRDESGERTCWRHLAVVEGSRLLAAIFRSRREAARRAPELDALPSSLRVGKRAVAVGPETPVGGKSGGARGGERRRELVNRSGGARLAQCLRRLASNEPAWSGRAITST